MTKYTGFNDDNDNPINVGDKLRSVWGYFVTVVENPDKEGHFYCKLVCEDDHSCKDIPYSLGGGYVKVNLSREEKDNIVSELFVDYIIRRTIRIDMWPELIDKEMIVFENGQPEINPEKEVELKAFILDHDTGSEEYLEISE